MKEHSNKNWADAQMSGWMGMTFASALFFGMVLFLMATGVFLFGNGLYWVFDGTWTGTGFGMYLRFSILCWSSAIIGAGFLFVLASIARIIDHNNENTEDHNSVT
jgi:hypothetical protein